MSIWRVDIVEQGATGTVTYIDPMGSIPCYWEYGGGETIAIIHAGTAAEWQGNHPWAVSQRAEILRRIADEVVRQVAPKSLVRLDDAAGFIYIQGSKPSEPHTTGSKSREQKRFEAAAWMRRYSKLRMKLGLVVLGLGLIAAGFMWFKNKFLVIDPGKGTPIGLAVRTDQHIATLIQSLVPYTPSLHRDGSKDRYRVSVFLVPLNGSDPRMIPVTGELEGNSFSLAKILGSDGNTLWFDVNGLGGVDLRTFDLVGADNFRRADPTLDAVWWEDQRGIVVNGRLRSISRDQKSALEFDPGSLKATPVDVSKARTGSPNPLRSEQYLCAGAFTDRNTWLGLHSQAESDREFKPKSFLKRMVLATDAKEQRHFFHGRLDPDSSDEYHRILGMEKISDETFLNAAFIRMDDASEAIRLTSPDGFLILFTDKPGLGGTLVVARVDIAGKPIWRSDTGIDRFRLAQILPGTSSIAFIGPRPQVPNKLSEPLLVIVESGTGKTSTSTLWK
jgi:hypothetical protein